MEVQPDFKELLELLNAHKAEFIIVGTWRGVIQHAQS